MNGLPDYERGEPCQFGGALPSWDECTRLLQRVFARRSVAACDIVEVCPIPGLVAPNFTAARLVHRILALQMALGRRPAG